jgi:23S rRNA pseudouridine2604 synthase
MTSDSPHFQHDDDDGVRLAKRVAALTGLSRREAELLIDNGVVRVDGTVAVTPQMRVRPDQRVEVEKNATPQPVPPVTIVLHKAPGVRLNPAAPLAGARHSDTDRSGLRPLPRHLVDLRCVASLAPHDSGLVVFTQVHGIERKLHEDAGIMEHELQVEVDGEHRLAARRQDRAALCDQRPAAGPGQRHVRACRAAHPERAPPAPGPRGAGGHGAGRMALSTRRRALLNPALSAV